MLALYKEKKKVTLTILKGKNGESPIGKAISFYSSVPERNMNGRTPKAKKKLIVDNPQPMHIDLEEEAGQNAEPVSAEQHIDLEKEAGQNAEQHIDLEEEAGQNAARNEGPGTVNEGPGTVNQIDWSMFHEEPMQPVQPTQESVNYILVPGQYQTEDDTEDVEPMQTLHATQESVNYVLVPDKYQQSEDQTQDEFCYADSHVEEEEVEEEVEEDQEKVEEEVEHEFEDNGSATDESSDSEYIPDHDEVQQSQEDLELKELIAEMNRERNDPLLHCEGDIDVEDIFELDPEDEIDHVVEEPKRKKARREGPTRRAHSEPEVIIEPDFIPSGEEDNGEEPLDVKDEDGAEEFSYVMPQGRKSRVKKAVTRVWYNAKRKNPQDQFCLRMCFLDVYQFREALIQLHISQSRDFKYHRNNKDRIIGKCIKADCPFYMVGSKVGNELTFCLRKMHLTHTCGTTRDSTRVNAKWLSKDYESDIRANTSCDVTGLLDNAKRDYGIEVNKMAAYRAKNRAIAVILGDHIKQYPRIRDYMQTVLDTNPGSRCTISTVRLNPAANPRFHGLFFCINAAKEGFLKGCRPFIGVDGCFIKLCTGAQILAATGRDGNNNIYPIAFAVVGKEDIASWCWFLQNLKYALGGESGQFGYYTIMSDRQKGLLTAINRVFPNCPQRFCLRHIYANFQTAGFRGADLKKLMDAASYSYSKNAFDNAMDDMHNECEDAAAWLSKIPPATWARHAFDTNCTTDLVVNNLSEVFNKFILDVRKKPIVTMIEGIRTKLMIRFNLKREGVAGCRWEITPTYAERLEIEKKWSNNYKPICAGPGIWQVSSGQRTHVVNLDERTCGCRKWDITGMPCNHAISAIYKSKQHPEDFVHEFFKKEMYKQAFNPIVYPVPSQDQWTRTPTDDIDPPVFTKHPGRPKEKRRRGQFEVPKKKDSSRMAPITCSNCKRQGHRFPTCSLPLKPDLQIRRNQHMANRTIPDEVGSSSAATAAPAPTARAPTPSSATRTPAVRPAASAPVALSRSPRKHPAPTPRTASAAPTPTPRPAARPPPPRHAAATPIARPAAPTPRPAARPFTAPRHAAAQNLVSKLIPSRGRGRMWSYLTASGRVYSGNEDGTSSGAPGIGSSQQ